jgi:hypothetical protein
MKTSNVNRIAAVLLAATGALHLVLVPEYLGEKPYVGVLFAVGGLAALGLAARLWSTASDRLAWAGGALVAAGMGIGFLLSRTVGLPGFHPHDWELSGLLSLVLEAGVVVAALAAIRAGLDRGPRGATLSA